MFKENKVFHERLFLSEEGLDAIEAEVSTTEWEEVDTKQVVKGVHGFIRVGSSDKSIDLGFFGSSKGDEVINSESLDTLIEALMRFRKKLLEEGDKL